ncbi:fungal-specific transcription factor domain-containing protein [Leptodontidium sp. 2 PMI_412]|nr:fungal-specific transcription factor domain-containing protein [Leptodontidium sp. 2 PMI_412]
MEEDTVMRGDELACNAAHVSVPRKPKRVAAACDRCRRQKLRCDSERPCALCVRSSLPCVSEGVGRKRKPRHEQPRNERPPKPQAPVTIDENSPGITVLNLRAGPAPSTIPGSELLSDQPVEESTLTPESNTSQGRRERLNGPHLKQYSQSSSTIGLSQEVFKQFSNVPLESHETGALPGGAPNLQHVDRQVQVVEVVGIELPPKHVMDSLLGIYLNSVHWFMAVLDEESFQSEYNVIAVTGLASHRQFRFLMVLLVVLSMGARYANQQNDPVFLDVDLEGLPARLLAKVRENMDNLLDEGEIESVQICILLSSHYLYHGRPNLAFITLGTGVKSAQAMGLHNEATWNQVSTVAIEIRRRVWLALYVFDRFASIVFGRPCSIRDADFEVSMPQGLGGTTAHHPHLSSFEDLDDVQNIHDQLIAWSANLPPELRLAGTSADNSFQEPVGSPIAMTFRLQALALQLAYDNILILLHRPLLSHNAENIATQNLSDLLAAETGHGRVSGLRSGSRTPNSPFTISTLSKSQCWESAYRTSTLSQHETLLRRALETHAASYIGIHMFTAGTILSIVALSRPLSSRAQMSKRAIARVIRMSNMLGRYNKLAAQSERILEEFVRLVLAKEMAAILSDDGRGSRHGQGQGQLHAASAEGTTSIPSTPMGVMSTANSGTSNVQTQSLDNGGGAVVQDPFFAFSDPDFATFTQYDMASFDNVDFNEGISSMRQVIRDNSNDTSGYRAPNVPDMNGAHIMLGGADYTRSENTFEASGGIRDPGQMWVWNTSPLNFTEGPLM